MNNTTGTNNNVITNTYSAGNTHIEILENI